MAVPKAMQTTYDIIKSILEPYCDEQLNSEYKELCLHALEKLCRKRPSPLLYGRAYIWAAGIVYAIGQNNFIFDQSRHLHKSADELSEPFGLAKTTVSSKAAEVRKLLKISQSNPEWTLPSDVENNPLLWMVNFNGMCVDARMLPPEIQTICAERGLIPHVTQPKGK
ncbi:MAG: hypothetical protein IJ523_02715 [Succinivibrionaceae bacterium]|nr:hypothetical protein [Succinivibrionaceae bacterium]